MKDKVHLIDIVVRDGFDDACREALYKLYNDNEKLRLKADEIHHSRLMEGKACKQCIEMAIHQLKLKITATFKIEPPPPA